MILDTHFFNRMSACAKLFPISSSTEHPHVSWIFSFANLHVNSTGIVKGLLKLELERVISGKVIKLKSFVVELFVIVMLLQDDMSSSYNAYQRGKHADGKCLTG